MFRREPDEQVTKTPRRRRFWLLAVGMPLLVGSLALVGWMLTGSSHLQQAIAEADAQDADWRLQDLERVRTTPPPGQNASERVVALIRTMPMNWLDAKKDALLNDLQPSAQLNDEQFAAVRAILQAVGPDALAQARALIETPHGRNAIVWAPDWISTMLADTQNHRSVAGLLRYDMLERAQAGDLAGAVAACHATFHTGCALGDEPLLISQLVRIAIQAVAIKSLERTLAQGEPPADALAALQDRIAAEEPAPLLWYGVRGERAGGNKLFEGLRNGNVSAANLGMIGGGAGPGASIPLDLLLRIPGYATSQHAAHLHYLNELAEIAKRPPHEWKAAFAAKQAELPNLPILVRMLAPAVNKVAEACQRNHAMLRNSIVALAAERFRQQRGRWPATVGELVDAKLLPAVPTDPFDGRPVRLLQTSDGVVVYCVGPDGNDDGGQLDARNPTRVGADIGFQLWNVPARRGPAPPKLDNPDGAGGLP